MNTQIEQENLIQRYLTGEATEQEAKQIQEWLQASEENRQLFARHKKLWIEVGALAWYDADQIKQGRKEVDLKIRNRELQQNFDLSRKRFRIFAYAASALLLLGITSIMYVMRTEISSKPAVVSAGGAIEVPYGSKVLTTLPDGSKVWVNAGSKISYSADFGSTSRTVYLTGEAYFDVVKMEKTPFYVNTDLLKVKVFGTAFNVKAYSDDDRVETTLDRGAISIIRNDAPDKVIKVVPNQKVTIMRDARNKPVAPSSGSATSALPEPAESLKILEVKNTETITAWKDNRLVFEQEPLWSLAKLLERRYNVEIKFNDEKIKTIRFTAAIKEIPIEQVLKAISMSSPIGYRLKGSEVTLFENDKNIHR